LQTTLIDPNGCSPLLQPGKKIKESAPFTTWAFVRIAFDETIVPVATNVLPAEYFFTLQM
jgi:hypothetical protein